MTVFIYSIGPCFEGATEMYVCSSLESVRAKLPHGFAIKSDGNAHEIEGPVGQFWYSVVEAEVDGAVVSP